MKKNAISEYFYEVLLVPAFFLLLGVIFLFAAYYFSSPPMPLEAHGQKLLIPNSDPLIKFLLKEVGFAFFVAATLAVSIDFLNRRKHEAAADRLVNRMKENLFHAVFGKDISPQIYEQIKKHCLEADFLRTELKVAFIFGTSGKDEENPNPNEKLKYVEQTSYVVKNISSDLKKYQLKMSVLGSANEIQKGPSSYVFENCKINGVAAEFKIERDPALGKLSAIHEIELSPGESAKIDSATHAYVRYSDETVYMMNIPTENVSISAVSHVQGMIVRASANHPEELVEVRSDPDFMEWRLDAGMFTGQGFLISWEMK